MAKFQLVTKVAIVILAIVSWTIVKRTNTIRDEISLISKVGEVQRNANMIDLVKSCRTSNGLRNLTASKQAT